MTTITIPAAVTSIGQGAFGETSLTTAYVDSQPIASANPGDLLSYPTTLYIKTDIISSLPSEFFDYYELDSSGEQVSGYTKYVRVW